QDIALHSFSMLAFLPAPPPWPSAVEGEGTHWSSGSKVCAEYYWLCVLVASVAYLSHWPNQSIRAWHSSRTALTSSLSSREREERPRPGLFHRDGLREIARLVDVTPALDGAVIGEELERDHGRDGLQEIEVGGGINDVVRDRGDLLIALGGDGDHLPAATLDLLHIGDDLVVHHILRGQTD